MPLRVKLAFILVAALLLPGVTPKSLRRSVEATVTPYPSVTDGPKADNLEKEAALEKNELESNEMVTDSSEVEDDATESTLLAEEDAAKVEETNEEIANSSDDYSDSKTVDDTAEGEIPPDLVGDGITEDEIAEAAEMMSLIVKRATEEVDKVHDPQSDSIDVDNFQFSDFPKIIEPFLRAFSDPQESETSKVLSEEDFFYWFPAIKKFLEFTMMESGTVRPTGVQRSSATKPARRSGLPTSPEPSRQIAPAPTKPTESDVLPPTLQDVFVTPELPTIARPLSPVQPSLSDVSDTEERVY